MLTIQNWKDGNYPIGGIPQIDEDGIADLSGMAEKGYIDVYKRQVPMWWRRGLLTAR